MRWPCNGSKFLWTGPWACWAANHPLHQWPSEKGRPRVRQFGLVASSWCILIENDEIANSLLLTLAVKMFHSCRCRSPKKSTKKGENFCRNWRSLKSAWSSTGPGWLKVIPRDRRLLRQCLSTSQCRRTAVIPNLLVKKTVEMFLMDLCWKKQAPGPRLKSNISLENWWLEDGISCWNCAFSGEMLIFRGVIYNEFDYDFLGVVEWQLTLEVDYMTWHDPQIFVKWSGGLHTHPLKDLVYFVKMQNPFTM